jgi:DNA-binding CsgD family transcriptional regulator
MRADYAAGVGTQYDIALVFGVHPNTVSRHCAHMREKPQQEGERRSGSS